MTQYFSQQQIQDALRSCNGPDDTDNTKAPLGSHVLVYLVHREESDGSFSWIEQYNETCTVLDKNGLKYFFAAVTEPYHRP